jgi:hypothetical protein
LKITKINIGVDMNKSLNKTIGLLMIISLQYTFATLPEWTKLLSSNISNKIVSMSTQGIHISKTTRNLFNKNYPLLNIAYEMKDLSNTEINNILKNSIDSIKADAIIEHLPGKINYSDTEVLKAFFASGKKMKRLIELYTSNKYQIEAKTIASTLLFNRKLLESRISTFQNLVEANAQNTELCSVTRILKTISNPKTTKEQYYINLIFIDHDEGFDN